MESTKRTTCRACGSSDLTELFSLGDQLVSDFPDRLYQVKVPVSSVTPWVDVVAGLRVPITLDLCRSCTLVQARHTPPPDLLYRRHYHYRSGVTATMRAALADVAEACRQRVQLFQGDVVLDIGSNDGTFLKCWGEGLITVGCEPAANFAECYASGDPILIDDFWSAKAYDAALKEALPRIAKRWPAGHAHSGDFRPKVVTALGMLYDLDDPNQFVGDVAKVLHPEGVFVAQLMCLRQMLRQNDVGNLAHEHLEFYTLRSLVQLFARHGLEVYDVEENDVNGGSYRIFARHRAAKDPATSLGGAQGPGTMPQIILKALHAEKRAGLGDAETIRETVDLWFLRQEELRERLMQFVRHQVVNLKRRLWVYGASTKGNVLLQWWGIGPELAMTAADRDPLKHGRFTVNGIPIRSEEDFRKENPEYALVLPYSFRIEFLDREREWLQRGGKFIFPLPKLEVVGAEGKICKIKSD